MEGYIYNGSGKSVHIFKRKFPARHKLMLDEIWPVFENKAKAELSKSVVTEQEFVEWLASKGFMLNGFEYVAPEKAFVSGAVESATSAEFDENGISADGRLERPSLDGAPQRVIDKLTYNDIASLRVVDKPKNIVSQISNKSKLRRAFTIVRQSGRKAFLEKVLRERLQDLERMS